MGNAFSIPIAASAAAVWGEAPSSANVDRAEPFDRLDESGAPGVPAVSGAARDEPSGWSDRLQAARHRYDVPALLLSQCDTGLAARTPNQSRMRRLFVRVTPFRLVAALAAFACLAAPAVVADAFQPANPPQPNAVVGLVDTGIDAYHAGFRDRSPRAYEHPSTYLPGYPKNAVALRLTLDTKDYWAAVRKDCATWAKVKPGTLYWIPGTRIVGAISFKPAAAVNCEADKPAGMPILDEAGHGTMTASRATGAGYGACRTCLVVSAQYVDAIPLVGSESSTKPAVDAIRFLAKNNTWIDAQSNSWGPFVPGWDPTGKAGLLTANPELVKAVEEVSKAHLAFWAAGNGAAFRFGIVGHPTLLTPHLGPSAIIVGGHDSGMVITWPGFAPHVVSDACNSWAAKAMTTRDSGDSVGGGTSGATPFVAGSAGEILLEARGILGDPRTGVRGDVVAKGRAGIVKTGPLADGVLTLAEWRQVLFETAVRRPLKQYEDGPVCTPTSGGSGMYDASPVAWNQVPDQFPEYTLIGYGAVDRTSVAVAGKVLRGTAPLPARPDTDRYFATDRQVRETTATVFRGP
jgi:hypothetical protein